MGKLNKKKRKVNKCENCIYDSCKNEICYFHGSNWFVNRFKHFIHCFKCMCTLYKDYFVSK